MKIARVPVSSLPKGVPGLVRWIKATHPAIYNNLTDRLSVMRMAGMGLAVPENSTTPQVDVTKVADAGGGGVANMILNTVKDLVSVGLPLYQQNKLFDLQLKRAQQGLAPLDTASIADASAMRFGVDSATRNTGLIVAGVLVVGVLGFALLRRRR